MTATSTRDDGEQARTVSPNRGPNVSNKSKKEWAMMMHKRWDAACRRIVCTVTYRFQLFLLNRKDLAIEGPIYRAMKAEMGLNADEREVVRWWLVSGKKVYAKALSQKRQTLTNTAKTLVISEFCYEMARVLLFMS